MDISQLLSLLRSGALNRTDTYILSDYFLNLNHVRFPLLEILPIIHEILPEFYKDIKSIFTLISDANNYPKEYNNMSLSAKQIICAIYIYIHNNHITKKDIYAMIIALAGRFFNISKDVENDGITMEMQALDNLFQTEIFNLYKTELKKKIWDIAVSINPLQRYHLVKDEKNIICNTSDAVLMPTYGISWELFHNDMIRKERETNIISTYENEIVNLQNYFKYGWLGSISNSAFSRFPKRLLNQLLQDNKGMC